MNDTPEHPDFALENLSPLVTEPTPAAPKKRAPRKPKATPEAALLDDTALLSADQIAPIAAPLAQENLADDSPADSAAFNDSQQEGAQIGSAAHGGLAEQDATWTAHDDDGAQEQAFVPRDFSDIVSGQFDAEQEGERRLPPKRVLPPLPESPKLHKVLAQAGLGSRLEMEQMIADGLITVNGQRAHVGQRVQWGDEVRVQDKLLQLRIQPPRARVIAYHKPAGEIVTYDDPQNRPTVFRRLPRLPFGKWLSVGRLDINTEGLLLFTNSGELANRLMHPRFGLKREYAVRILGELTPENRQRLLAGIELEDGPAQFLSIEDGGGDGANRWVRVVIGEGRNREVRRMFEAIGHAVSRLIRIRYGAYGLPKGLRRGVYMELNDREIDELTQSLVDEQGAEEPKVGAQAFAVEPAQRRTPREGQGVNRGHREPRERRSKYGRRGRDDRYDSRGGSAERTDAQTGLNEERRYPDGAARPSEPAPGLGRGARNPRFERNGRDFAPGMNAPSAPRHGDEEDDDFSQAGISHESAYMQAKKRRGGGGGSFGAGGPMGGGAARRNYDDGPPPGVDPSKTSFGYITQDGFRKQGLGGGAGTGGGNSRRSSGPRRSGGGGRGR